MRMKRMVMGLLFLLSFSGWAGVQAIAVNNSIEGIWRMEGYGVVFQCAGGKITIYETTSISGMKGVNEGRYSRDIVQLVADSAAESYHYTIEKDRLTLSNPSYGECYGARRIPALPKPCLNGGTKQSQDPELNFEIFWRTFNEQYAFFQLRGVNWEHQYRLYRPQVNQSTTSAQLFGIFCKMVEPLRDTHVSVKGLEYVEMVKRLVSGLTAAEQETLEKLQGNFDYGKAKMFLRLQFQDLANDYGAEERKVFEHLRELSKNLGAEERRLVELAQNKQITFEDQLVYRNGYDIDQFNLGMEWFKKQAGAVSLGQNNVTYRILNNNIGLITIFAMDGYSENGELSAAVQVMDQVIEALAGCRAIIVDVRFNEGGYDTISRLWAGHFAGRRQLAFSKQARDGNHFTPLDDLYVEPQGPRQYQGKVVVLTSRNTISAGETFVICMKDLPNVTLMGEPTNGVNSNVLGRALPNGWFFGLSNERYLASDKRVYEKIGVYPDISVALDFSQVLQGKDHIMAEALKYLGE